MHITLLYEVYWSSHLYIYFRNVRSPCLDPSVPASLRNQTHLLTPPMGVWYLVGTVLAKEIDSLKKIPASQKRSLICQLQHYETKMQISRLKWLFRAQRQHKTIKNLIWMLFFRFLELISKTYVSGPSVLWPTYTVCKANVPILTSEDKQISLRNVY